MLYEDNPRNETIRQLRALAAISESGAVTAASSRLGFIRLRWPRNRDCYRTKRLAEEWRALLDEVAGLGK